MLKKTYEMIAEVENECIVDAEMEASNMREVMAEMLKLIAKRQVVLISIKQK